MRPELAGVQFQHFEEAKPSLSVPTLEESRDRPEKHYEDKIFITGVHCFPLLVESN